MSIEEHDEREIRCRRLGHAVKFGYCRRPGRDLPCGKILDCWWEQFDVEGWLRGHFSEAEVAEVLEPPVDKVVSLIELIEEARRRTETG